MKIAIVKCCAAALLIMLSVASPAAGPVGEEPAVWQALVKFIADDNKSRPYRLLYFQTDYEIAPLITNSMTDPTRREFKDLCGLSASDAKAMVAQIKAVNAEPVEFDKAMAEAGDLKLVKKKKPPARYVALSRVVFDPSNQHAWVAVDLGGVAGSILRLDKVADQWSKTARCGGWIRSE